MKVQTKLLLLIVTLAVVLGVVVVFHQVAERKSFVILFQQEAAEKNVIFDKILGLKRKALETFVRDYCEWDELVYFITARDRVWASKNIDSALTKYAIDAVWLCDADGVLLYSVNEPNDEALHSLPLLPSTIRGLFSKRELRHFFIKTQKAQLVEIYGTTLHLVSDSETEAVPRGYIFAGKVWDNRYIKELIELSGGTIVLTLPEEENIFVGNLNPSQGVIGFLRILSDWEGKPLVHLNMWFESMTVKEFNRIIKNFFRLFLISSLTVVLIVFFGITRWIHTPLHAISATLQTEYLGHLKALKGQRNEFGDISRLIEVFFKQRLDLINEINQRRKTEEALTSSEERLSKINECFLKFGIDPLENIKHLTDLTGGLFGAAAVFYNRLYQGRLYTIRGFNIPSDYPLVEEPEGRICYEVILKAIPEVFIVRHLPQTIYAHTDPYVNRYQLQTYLGHVVKCRRKAIGSVCIVYQRDYIPSEEDKRFLSIIASAIGIEEERRFVQDELKTSMEESEQKKREVLKMLTELDNAHKALLSANEELKRTQSQLIQTSKMAAVGQLASGVAHEINNPLTGLLNNLQLIKMEAARKAEFTLHDFKELLRSIEESALRCKRITKSLLDFSHASSGKFQMLHLNTLIENAVSVIRHEMQVKNINIQSQLKQNLPQVLGDAQLLQQVIFNIVSNAVWAIEKRSAQEGGTISIVTHYDSQGKTICLSISDTGIGIPKDNLERIFEPFFTTKPVGEGTGLGLSIVYNVIAKHNGAIEVESEEGKGTTFKIYIPAAI